MITKQYALIKCYGIPDKAAWIWHEWPDIERIHRAEYLQQSAPWTTTAVLNIQDWWSTSLSAK